MSIVIIGVLIALLLLAALSALRVGREPSLWRALPGGLATAQEQALQDLNDTIGQLNLSNAEKQDALKDEMAVGLDKLRTENSERLEAIRRLTTDKAPKTEG